MNNIHYIVNPASQGGATGRRWPGLLAQLPKAARIHETRARDEAGLLAERAAKDGADLIVAVGGDGTLSEVVNGLMRIAPDSRPKLGLVPCGTGGDFRKTLGLPTSPLAIARVLERGESRGVDVGRVRFTTAGGAQERHFINIASFGVSGVVVRAVNGTGKLLGGRVSFLLGTLRGFTKYSSTDLEMSIDGGSFEPHRAMLVAACNGRMFGGGMQLAPTADPSDGHFDLVIWDNVTSLGKLGMWRIYNGSHLGLPNVHYVSAKRIRARSTATVLVEADGELLGQLPIDIDIQPQALRVVC